MDLTTRASGSAAILELAGRFDAYVVGPVNESLDQAAAKPPAHVVVNLASVNFVDSTALAALVRSMKRCRQQGGDLHLCGLQQPVRIIFELTRLDRAIEIFPDEEQAVKAFGN